MGIFRSKSHDWFLTLVIFLLVLIGLVVIYSSTFTAVTLVEGAGTLNRQLVFVILGFGLYFLISSIDPSFYRYTPVKALMFLIMTALLVYVWLFGDPIRNTNRWIEWGFIRIQPSEYSKVVLILLNSSILAQGLKSQIKQNVAWKSSPQAKGLRSRIVNIFKRFLDTHSMLYIYATAILMSALYVGLILVEPALGNAVITAFICLSLFLTVFPDQQFILFFFITFAMGVNIWGGVVNLQVLYKYIGISLISWGVDWGLIVLSFFSISCLAYYFRLNFRRVILAIALGVLVVFVFSYVWANVLQDYQRRRVETFLNPEHDPQGAGWQLRQAEIAIGSGRVWGKGFLQGSQSKLRYLPEAYSDFAFAAFCEEFGLLGASLLFGLYLFLLFRIIVVARKARDDYEVLVCLGVASMILIHVFISISMNLGILPVTGIPLPLISYGGSSIMVTMIALGLVQAVNMNRDIIDMEESLVITSSLDTDSG